MAVRVMTNTANELLVALKSGVANGDVSGWKVDIDGDLTLSGTGLANQAWMRPKILSDRLLFNIIGKTGQNLSTKTYAVFHARLIELLLLHFDSQFQSAAATSMPLRGDILPTED